MVRPCVASNGPNGSPGFACAGKTGPPSRFILSQTSAGKRALCHPPPLIIQFLFPCHEPVPSFSNRRHKRKRILSCFLALTPVSFVRPRRRLSSAPTVDFGRRRAQELSRSAVAPS